MACPVLWNSPFVFRIFNFFFAWTNFPVNILFFSTCFSRSLSKDSFEYGWSRHIFQNIYPPYFIFWLLCRRMWSIIGSFLWKRSLWIGSKPFVFWVVGKKWQLELKSLSLYDVDNHYKMLAADSVMFRGDPRFIISSLSTNECHPLLSPVFVCPRKSEK